MHVKLNNFQKYLTSPYFNSNNYILTLKIILIKEFSHIDGSCGKIIEVLLGYIVQNTIQILVLSFPVLSELLWII